MPTNSFVFFFFDFFSPLFFVLSLVSPLDSITENRGGCGEFSRAKDGTRGAGSLNESRTIVDEGYSRNSILETNAMLLDLFIANTYVAADRCPSSTASVIILLFLQQGIAELVPDETSKLELTVSEFTQSYWPAL